jgi:cytidylate kinase
MKEKVIAIDGPSGSGKSTIAKMVSSANGLTYLDTGAMFRAIAYALKKLDIDFTKPKLTADESESIQSYLNSLEFEYGLSEDILIRLNGENLTSIIREHFVSEMASHTWKFSIIRNYLKEKQRSIANVKPSVLEGRDIGTVIFPNAALKIFLTASADERAKRRYEQLIEKDSKNKDLFSVQGILEDIEKRDTQDRTRDLAPLSCAKDAIEIDTTTLSIEEVVARITKEFNSKKEFFI